MRWYHWALLGTIGLLSTPAGIGYMKTRRLEPKLRYFKPSEFGLWWPFMADELVLKLDEFRHQLGTAVVISNAAGGLGRRIESDGHDGFNSQHNFLRWGEVRAADVFPVKVDCATCPVRGFTEDEMRDAVAIAERVGFRGIGVYSDTHPWPMLHLDVRRLRDGQDTARWGRIEHAYTTQNRALASIDYRYDYG